MHARTTTISMSKCSWNSCGKQTEERNIALVRLSRTVFKQRKSEAVRNGLLFGRGITLEQIEIGLWQRQVVASPCHPVWLQAVLAHYSKTGEVDCFDSRRRFLTWTFFPFFSCFQRLLLQSAFWETFPFQIPETQFLSMNKFVSCNCFSFSLSCNYSKSFIATFFMTYNLIGSRYLLVFISVLSFFLSLCFFNPLFTSLSLHLPSQPLICSLTVT